MCSPKPSTPPIINEGVMMPTKLASTCWVAPKKAFAGAGDRANHIINRGSLECAHSSRLPPEVTFSPISAAFTQQYHNYLESTKIMPSLEGFILLIYPVANRKSHLSLC